MLVLMHFHGTHNQPYSQLDDLDLFRSFCLFLRSAHAYYFISCTQFSNSWLLLLLPSLFVLSHSIFSTQTRKLWRRKMGFEHSLRRTKTHTTHTHMHVAWIESFISIAKKIECITIYIYCIDACIRVVLCDFHSIFVYVLHTENKSIKLMLIWNACNTYRARKNPNLYALLSNSTGNSYNNGKNDTKYNNNQFGLDCVRALHTRAHHNISTKRFYYFFKHILFNSFHSNPIHSIHFRRLRSNRFSLLCSLLRKKNLTQKTSNFTITAEYI